MSLIGRTIKGNFEVLEKIGQGGMAAVYRGRQISLDRTVAIKVLSGALVDVAEVRERFEQEAKIIARLTHPNIVQVHEICEIEDEDAGLCIVMEYIDGRSLQEILQEQRPLAIERAMAIAEQIAAGLAYAHTQGVIHRDVKPQNVMLMSDDLVKIMDFGIARLGGSAIRTMTGSTMGTPEYMSPEQAGGKPVDHRSDIYSLAVVLYVMMAGELPFTGESPVAIGLKHIQEAPRPPREINPAIPDTVEAIILKGMAKKPAARFDNAEELRRMLINCTPTIPVDGSRDSEATVIAGVAPTPGAEAPPREASAGVADVGASSVQEAVYGVRLRLARLAEAAGPFVRSVRWIVTGVGVLVVLVVLVLVLSPGNGGRETITPEDLRTLPPLELLERFRALRRTDAGEARRSVAESEKMLYDRIREEIRQAESQGNTQRVAALRSAAERAILPDLTGESRDRWNALIAQPGTRPTPFAVTPTPTTVASHQPPPRPPEPTPREDIGTPPMTAREIELSMRRLNDPVAQDAARARRGFQAAQAAMRQSADVPISQWRRDAFSQCVNGFIDAIQYDPKNWRHHLEFARFLADNVGGWNLPDTVRDGLLHDAREIARRAATHCTDPSARGQITALEATIDGLLQGR